METDSGIDLRCDGALFAFDPRGLAELKVRRGKVREVYAGRPGELVIVATDRISAFDCILPTPIPGKGRVLTGLSRFWFETFDRVPNHLLSTEVGDFPEVFQPFAEMLQGRAILSRAAEPLPIECVARGYLAGSGWKEYQATGGIAGQKLPEGLRQADRLPEPLFTPTTKADLGHDEPITMRQCEELLGADLAGEVRALTLELYRQGAEHAARRGVIIADTKFEFGRCDGELILIDEVLTPDSSRFWPEAAWVPGMNPPSFDKQFVRDYLEGSGWDKRPPAPELPESVVMATREKYEDALRLLTGEGRA